MQISACQFFASKSAIRQSAKRRLPAKRHKRSTRDKSGIAARLFPALRSGQQSLSRRSTTGLVERWADFEVRMNDFWRYLLGRWERILFGCVGAACLTFTFVFLWHTQVTAASAVFAMAFFSFFYSNLARFKKFKGLGFEAELWEDKQKEAAHLIDRLKDVVTVYTREIVMNSVLRGRMGGGDSWQKRWDLFNGLQGRHGELGQQIDFTDLRHDVESAFLFDMCSPLAASVKRSIESAKVQVQKDAQKRFGSPVTNLEGWNNFHAQLRALGSVEGNLFERAKTRNIAQETLDTALSFKAGLMERFSIDLVFTPGLLERLSVIADIASRRPIAITPELIEWADDPDAFTVRQHG